MTGRFFRGAGGLRLAETAGASPMDCGVPGQSRQVCFDGGRLGLAGSLSPGYSKPMTIELPATVEKELRHLAVVQSRDIGELVEEAVRQYLDSSAITDLDADQVAETQMALVGELQGIPEWKAGRE